MTKHKVTHITLIRAEGPTSECDKPKDVTSFLEANSALYRWSTSAPKHGGYDKCDFWIEWEDGEKYEGRYDLTHWTKETPDLGRHVRSFVGYMAGTKKPLWMKPEMWERVCRENAKDAPAWQEFEANHELG